MNDKLERAFDKAMIDIYTTALKEANYRATRFFEMLQRQRGVQTAKQLLSSNTPSDGYTALYERGRLDLTVEALIYDNPNWYELFTGEEIERCRARLEGYGYLK